MLQAMKENNDRLRVEGVSEHWYRPEEPRKGDWVYRPAVLVECTINYRSLRAGLNQSEEHNYTAWLPEGDAAIDWDHPAVIFDDTSRLSNQPERLIPYASADHSVSADSFAQYEAELAQKLARAERLKIYFSPVFGLFSSPDESLEDFLGRVAEAALGRVEPELERLRNRVELQIEQIREAQTRKGLRARDEISLDKIISLNLQFFESENRLASMFSTLAGAVFGTAAPASETEPVGDVNDEKELRQDLQRVEQEAREALAALYEEYLALANEYDPFEIGLQPNNIQIIRSGILWVPVS